MAQTTGLPPSPPRFTSPTPTPTPTPTPLPPTACTANDPQAASTIENNDRPPRLNYTIDTPTRKRIVSIWLMLLFVESDLLPLILFFSLRWGAHLDAQKNLAIVTSLIGGVSGFKLAQRTYFLWFKAGNESRRPIGAGRWGLDFFHILINISIAAFFIPLIIGSSVTPASPPVAAIALPCFMITFCLPIAITGAFPHRLRVPFRVSSLPPCEPLPPITYTIIEDVIPVDGNGMVDFRQAWRDRYEASAVMRKLIRDTALGWGISGVVIGGVLVVAAQKASTATGYGLGYGIPWIWAFLGMGITVWWTQRELKRELRDWPSVHEEVSLHLVENPDDIAAKLRVMGARNSLSH